jgi:photosystem II stability/assembly factor-like uncharacterized protein
MPPEKRRMIRWQLLGLLLCLPAFVPARSQDPKAAVMDPDARLAWYQQHLNMREQSPSRDLIWKHIGPLRMSGRVTDIAVPPHRPFTFYVATASGGLWKTVNEGTTWEPIFDDAPSASTGAVAVSPSNPDVVWVGLGEANIFRSTMAGTGVYRSSDEGKTWEHRGLADSHHVGRIVIHPSDPDTVYVAASGHEYTPNAERGIFKTTDGGATWDRVLYVDDMTGGIDLVMDPVDAQTLFASMWHRIRRPWSDPLPGPEGGIYKTTDGGKSWTRLANGLPAQGSVGRMGVAVASSNPKVVYVLADNHEVARAANDDELDSYGRTRQEIKKGAEVYRSADGGASFVLMSGESKEMQRLFATYGWVFGQIRVDPTNEDTVYTMGVPLLKSTDGGRSFSVLDYRGLHGDHHALWIDPKNSNYLINGNDGGINLSYDGGATWKNDESLPCVQFYNVAVDNAKPFNVYGSIQDNGSWSGPSSHAPGRSPESRWRPIPGGEASYIAVDPDDPNTLYSESFYGRLLRSTLEPRSTKSIVPKAAPGEPPLRGQWLAPFVLSPHNSRIIYHGLSHVFRSVDRGESWERISPDLTFNDPQRQGNISYATISTLSESSLKFGLLYAGTDDGRLHMTRDGGVSWTEITRGLVPHKWFSRVAASRFAEGTVYATQNGKRDNDFQAYVWRSDDYGQTWTDIAGGIPGGPVNVIAEDPRSADVLYAGTDLGVYLSTDRGASWTVVGSGLPITFVHDLVVHPRDFVLVIATHGRGMFTLDVSKLVAVPEKEESDESKESKSEGDGEESETDDDES